MVRYEPSDITLTAGGEEYEVDSVAFESDETTEGADMTPIDECPVCGDSYALSYPIERGTKDVRSRMYSVKKICHAKTSGIFMAYMHGEEM